MHILDFQKPDEVIMINEEANQGNFEFRPLEPGYGLTIGSHNLVVTLNGRRLNNIDTSGPAISEVNINDIERVEITKGSGHFL